MANNNMYGKSVSDWSPKAATSDATEKLMNSVARESADNVSSNNEQKQFEGGKAAGKFGPLGKQGIGQF